MTTTVKVITHDRPAIVRTFPLENGQRVEGGEWNDLAEVEAHSEFECHVHDGQDVLVQEFNCLPEE